MFVFCKVNALLFSSLLNMIIGSVGRWVCGRWVGGSVGKWSVVGGSVVGGFNKTPGKHQCRNLFFNKDRLKLHATTTIY